MLSETIICLSCTCAYKKAMKEHCNAVACLFLFHRTILQLRTLVSGGGGLMAAVELLCLKGAILPSATETHQHQNNAFVMIYGSQQKQSHRMTLAWAHQTSGAVLQKLCSTGAGHIPFPAYFSGKEPFPATERKKNGKKKSPFHLTQTTDLREFLPKAVRNTRSTQGKMKLPERRL